MTQDEIIEMARQAGAGMLHGGEFALFGNEKLEAFAKLVADKEREACAKFVDHILKEGGGTYGDAIRARGQT
jgi:hypothetical protein